MEGKGIKYYANGNIHDGLWSQDKAHGSGKFYKAADGTYKDGEWEYGKLNTIWQTSGSLVIGKSPKAIGIKNKISEQFRQSILIKQQ